MYNWMDTPERGEGQWEQGWADFPPDPLVPTFVDWYWFSRVKANLANAHLHPPSSISTEVCVRHGGFTRIFLRISGRYKQNRTLAGSLIYSESPAQQIAEHPWSPGMLYLDHDWQYLMCTVKQRRTDVAWLRPCCRFFDTQASCDLHVLHLTCRGTGIIIAGGNHIQNICVLFIYIYIYIRNQMWFFFQ